MMYFTFFLSVTLFIYAVAAWQSEKKHRLQRRILSVTNGNKEEGRPDSNKEEKTSASFKERIIDPIWKQLSRKVQRKWSDSGEKIERLELQLLQAGNPFDMTPVDFKLLQIILLILLPIIFTGYALLSDFSGGVVILLAFLGLIAGRFLPLYYIKQKAKARAAQALRELPDFIDLLTVSLEAGLGFDSALNKVVAKKEGILSQEFRYFLEEIRLGKTRRTALSGIRNRLIVADLHTLISSIIQAEQLGVSMVNVLRVQSQEIRDRRKQRAEEAAMKAPIKMLFPLVLFIFPSLFIVLLGPAVIQIIQDLK
ncbi:MAG TPA: type II secretion system F family protein [Chondromyces sp.]|nr:type II secretion system F family protein [Chondromyces sp.]